MANETLLTEDYEDQNSTHFSLLLNENSVSGRSLASSPLSAVDIFTDYNTNILKAVFDQAEKESENSSSFLLA